MKRILSAILLFPGLCVPAAAFHPLISEDTVFLGTDVRQAEFGFEHIENTHAGDVFTNALTAEFSYGGYLYNRNSVDEEKNIFKASAAAALEVLPRTLVTADLAVESNTDKASSVHPVHSIFGVIWSPYDYLDLDAGVRVGLNPAADHVGLLAGFTLRI